MQSQLEENTQITKAILHRKDETDAKLDSLAMDVHKMHGEIPFLKENDKFIKHEITDIKGEFAYVSHKAYRIKQKYSNEQMDS